MENIKNKRVQIAFDATEQIRTEIKIVAAQRNITVNKWIMRAIIRALAEERK